MKKILLLALFAVLAFLGFLAITGYVQTNEGTSYKPLKKIKDVEIKVPKL